MKAIKSIFEFIVIAFVANSVTIGTFQTGCFLYRYSLDFAPLQKLFFAVCVAAILLLAIAIEYAFQAYKRKKIIIEIDRCKESPPALEQVFSEHLKDEIKELVKD
jgi:hypothetical protein